jgi:AcrR family transcriptional regulator
MKRYGKLTKDRRIEKTRRLLHEALTSLTREKPYEEIAVQEILDRANVGRSTFYMHFRGKDDLLVSVIHELIGPVDRSGEAPAGAIDQRITSFSLRIFEHIHLHRRIAAVVMGATAWAVVHEHLRRILAEQIADDLKRYSRARQRGTGQIPPQLLAQYVAATFILVLNWSVESRTRLQPKEVNTLFRSLVEPTLAKLFLCNAGPTHTSMKPL